MKKPEQMTPEELITEIKNLRARKKYGLVWEDKPEKVVTDCLQMLPVLVEDEKKVIDKKPNTPTNFIIEGDNYHSLSVLNYTHQSRFDVIYIDPPYNTGAQDWKYNNKFVDDNDTYRHSKWISMMEKRLLLAKNLLKPNGVVIITIDDYEIQNISKLLEDLNAKSLGRVSICIKPEGRRQSKYIMQAHEYALFVSWGNPTSRGLNVDFGLDFPEEDETSKFRWEGLMRRDAGREDRGSDYWYPMYVTAESEIIFERKSKTDIELYPVNTKGIERVWLWDRDRSINNLKDLKAVVRNGKATIYYKRREMGRVKPTSFWYGSKYNANAYGTRLLQKVLPGCDFDFPKSLYSVLDCIDMFLPENGLCLDYFAGSGTTGHAVLELNKSDKGNRTFILCTNNENGIAEDVTYPRIRNVISGYADVEGIPANVRYFRTNFVKKDKVSDDTRRELVQRATEMICVKEDTFTKKYDNKKYKIYENAERVTGILYDLDAIDDFKSKLSQLGKTCSIYVFSLTNETFGSDFADLSVKHKLTPIPESILEVYRKLFE